jgi:hypothetical protein
MKEGDIVLALLPQTDGRGKYWPAVVLRRMPGSAICWCSASAPSVFQPHGHPSAGLGGKPVHFCFLLSKFLILKNICIPTK